MPSNALIRSRPRGNTGHFVVGSFLAPPAGADASVFQRIREREPLPGGSILKLGGRPSLSGLRSATVRVRVGKFGMIQCN
jgi:hypothetical protein